MQDNLVAYLVGGLEHEERAELERYLEVDVKLQRQLDLLRGSLAPLAGDRDHVEAPLGLAQRTCRRIFGTTK